MKNKERKHNVELLQKSIIDQHKLLIHVLKKDNSRLYDVLLKDDELAQYVAQLTEDLQYILGVPNAEVQRKVVKNYKNIQELQNDFNKIVFVDTSSDEERTIYQIMYYKLVEKFNYNESIDVFVQKIKFIQDSNNLQDPTHEDSFDENVFKEIKVMMHKLRVKHMDVAYVANNKKYYVYDGNIWILEDEFKKKKTQRKVLSVRNRDVEFDGNRESVINDYLIQLIDNIQNKRISDIELQQLEDSAYQVSMAEKNEKKKKLKYNHILKYNKNKEIIELSLYHTKMTESSVFSKYMSLLNEIMAIEDESMKYEYVIRFIKKYTVDTGNDSWYMH